MVVVALFLKGALAVGFMFILVRIVDPWCFEGLPWPLGPRPDVDMLDCEQVDEGSGKGWSWVQMRNDDLKRIRLLMHEEEVAQRIADDHRGVHYEEPERLKVRK